MDKLRIATVSFLMEDRPHSVDLNLSRTREYVADASERGADVVCLPETVTTNGCEEPYELARLHSDQWIENASTLASEHDINLIFPSLVASDGAIYNQATIFDREGEIVGVYRKVQPTGSEARTVAPGDDFPVVELDGVRVAVMICMDIYFPEIARIYALKGAQVLFWPTTTHGPSQSGLEAQIRSRAIDNSLWIVESNLAGHPPYAPYAGRFYPGNARVIDFNGEILCQTGRRDGVALCTIDPGETRLTKDCLLINDPDRTREDLELLARIDLYAREYERLASRKTNYYDQFKNDRS